MSMNRKNDRNGKVSRRYSSSTYPVGSPQLPNRMSVMFNKREFMPGTIKLTTLVSDPRREPSLKT